ncbi:MULTISPECIES: hypothetical protein [unclassified Paracoccus (in: a-proteobacteria)]|uniref:hypothetical protein n=1 Tax=unclassified Paracoccus (in: a-proteobacteria) TaxID=2688777 RepID=UPI0012B1B663|nr:MULTISPECIES: hypothetical protein [unclassified Paracoccus (in: a-proteobacteria)]UXU76509.1 hypothetical protein GB879_014125 [Paracoccus sp. SMMA_5]UXU82424.1 hypothetical protein GB880_014310 [Paracoccus sp. SMMA_5_TC]
MLSFAPPIRLIAGHPVLADHDRADLFHVLPAAPALALAANGDPAFGLMRYLGDDAGGAALAGGFLSLATELTVPDGVQALIRQQLADQIGRVVQLSQPLFDDGQVELVLLGQASGADPGSNPGPFQVDVLGSARPAMAGRNAASFQVALNHTAAAFIEAAVGDPTLPALVIYRMALTGLQPGYRIQVNGDLSRLQDELDARFRANVYYLRADIARETRLAMAAAGVRVDTVVMDETAQDDAAAAERALLDWITDSFFDPQPVPPAPAGPAAGLVDGLLGGVAELFDTLMPGASFKLKSRRTEDLRQVHAVLQRTLARRRDLVFQATLGAELNARRIDETGVERADWPSLRDRLIGGVNIAAIPRREIRLGIMDRFASDGLAAVELDIALSAPDAAVPLHPRTVVFHDANQQHLYAVNLLDQPARLLTDPYHYRLRCHYDPASAFGPRPTEEGPWTQGRAGELIVDPRVDGPYRLRAPLLAVTPGFPFAQFPQVSIDLRRVEDGVETQRGALLLRADTPEARWIFRGHGAQPERFQFRTRFERPMPEGGPVISDWQDETGLRITLPDPLPHRRRATFFVSLPWAEVGLAFLEIRYDDDANGLHIDERVTLSSDQPVVDRDYAVADPALDRLQFRLTALILGRGFVQGDWRETTDTTIVLGRELVEMRAVRLRVLGLPLAAHGLAQLRLSAEAIGPGAVSLHPHSVLVDADRTDGDLGVWSFPRFVPPVSGLRVRADWRNADGFPDSTGWQGLDRDLALFRVPQMRFQL